MQIQKVAKLYIIIIFIGSCLGVQARCDENVDGKNKFVNQDLLNKIFEKLYNLEKNKRGKINIVHVGDSHIQADIFTNTIRSSLQSEFGNGGYGFTFPYRLIGTNGTYSVKYVSNANWRSQMNVSPVADVGVGLSGIALYTDSSDFIIQLSTDKKFEFNTIKIVYPTVEPQYELATTSEPLSITSVSTGSTVSGYKTHKVRSGESLSSIARKYRVTVTQIKTANRLRSNTIHAGRNLKIPTKATRSKTKVSTIKVDNDLVRVDLISKPYYSSYTSDSLLDRIAVLPNGNFPTYNLNGFVIENDKPGVVYHTIGVNGAKLSDYSKYPLFFKQLPVLEPDLVILSFGTNESFGKISTSDYIYQVRDFIKNIQKYCGKDVTVLVMTPPPSLFRRRRPNPFVTNYSIALMELNDIPVWDLYSRMGGLDGIRAKGEYSKMIARDNVHYTTKGYETQGFMFSEDFIDAYNNFKKHKRN